MGISKADSMNIMAVNAPDYAIRQILKSTDGGQTWNIVFEDPVDSTGWPIVHHIAKDISYPTKDFCIISCDSNYYLKTTDSGLTWKEFKTDIQYDEYYGLMNVSMYNDKIGIMNSAFDLIISDDGFETYKKIKLPGFHDILNAVKYSATGIYCLTLYPNILFSSCDNGISWVEHTFPNDTLPAYMFFVDSLNGFVAGWIYTGIGDNQYSTIYRTTDAGNNWERVLKSVYNPPYGLQKIYFFDRQNGIAVGHCGQILYTIDSGKSWNYDFDVSVFTGIPATLSTTMIGKNTALIADEAGRIWISSLITDIPEENKDEKAEIYPNPVSDFLHVNIEDEINTPISIYSIYGIKVLETSSKVIDVHLLPDGVYMLRTGSKFLKFIKI